MESPIKIVIIDDNQQFREGLYQLVNFSEGFEVIGVLENCLNIVDDIGKLLPEVILMDIDMPKITGIEATKIIKNKFPNILVIMLTVFENEDRIFSAIKAGAVGYLLKNSAPTRILEAIMEAKLGGAPMTPSVAKCVISYFNAPKTTNLEPLSPKQLEVLALLVKGYSYKMIAAGLAISIGTVRVHIKSIYEKLQVHSATEAMAVAINHRLV